MKFISKSWVIFIVSAMLLLAGLAYIFLYYVPMREAEKRAQAAIALEVKQTADTKNLFQQLEKQWTPFIRAEAVDSAAMKKALAELEKKQYQGLYTREPVKTLVAGLLAYSRGDHKAAEEYFAKLNAQGVQPNQELLSFQAAASLRLGNTASASDLYRQALDIKKKNNYSPLAMSGDQLGLALSLFLLGKTDEALPLAQEAYNNRVNGQADAIELLSAANRLATVEISLTRLKEAEKLLQPLYDYYSAFNEKMGDGRLNSVLEESGIILKLLSSKHMATENKEPVHEPAHAPEPQTSKPQTPAPSAEELACWQELAGKLQAANSPFAPLMLEHILSGEMQIKKIQDKYNSALLPQHTEIIKAYLNSGQARQAWETLAPMTNIQDLAGDIDFWVLAAECQQANGFYKGAEAFWQKAADLSDALLPDASTKVPAKNEDVSRSFNLHLNLAENYLKQKKVPEEAEIELMLSLGLINKKRLNDYPATAKVYFRLSLLLKDMGRKKDSQNYLRKACGIAENLLKKNTAENETEELKSLVTTYCASKQKKTKDEPVKEEAFAKLPDPQLLRDELRAMVIVHHEEIFKNRIEDILKQASALYGKDSADFFRYYSLKLKFLELSGALDELDAELEKQAAAPKGSNELEKSLNRSNAFLYAARVNKKAGRNQQAIEYYQKALDALVGNDEIIVSRRGQINNDLKRFKEFVAAK